MIKAIKNAKIVSSGKIINDKIILFDEDSIIDVCHTIPDNCETIDLKGKFISSGFIDIHCHGGGGCEFIDGTEESILKASEIHYQNGTRYLFPTISSCDIKTMKKSISAIKEAKAKTKLKLCGVHLEGPYFAPEMCGGQDPLLITKPIEKDYTEILESYPKEIARWSYAPELDTDNKFLKALNKYSVIGATAHSSAEYSDILRALNEGNKLITHLYSCTSTITRHGGFRHLGIIESAYLLDEIYVEAIGDGCHLPPELLKLIIKIKGADKVCLITDAIRYACLDNTESIKGGTASVPFIIEDGVAKLQDRSAFAGSIASTKTLLERTVKAGISLADTVKMMTETPAKIMNMKTAGKIEKGYDPIFTVFDEKYNIYDL